MAGVWPVHLEVSQSHSHNINNGWNLSITFEGLLGKTVLDGQQTEISYNNVGGRGRLGQEDDRCIEVDVQRNSSAPLSQLLHTWCCLFCCLNCYLSKGLFGFLEVIDEPLRGGKKGKQQRLWEKLKGVGVAMHKKYFVAVWKWSEF